MDSKPEKKQADHKQVPVKKHLLRSNEHIFCDTRNSTII